MQKYFFLGLGAQKCGTTWLHSYLSRAPNFDFGFTKEYHVWDAKFLDSCKNFRIKSERKISRKLYRLLFEKQKYLTYNFQKYDMEYERYFLSLINKNIDSTGDITPSYCGLHSDNLTFIKNKLEMVGFQVKVIFLMRDPFERCWSAARMEKHRSQYAGSDLEYLSRRYKSTDYLMRTSYQRTIMNIEKAFRREDVYYGIYEEMFTMSKINDLSRFCMIQPRYTEIISKKNGLAKSDLSALLIKSDIKKFYRETYEFCNLLFPQTINLWQ